MTEHRRTTVVDKNGCRVEACTCGVFHVSFGNLTLRLQRPQLELLFHALGDVLAPPSEGDDETGDTPIH